MTTVLLDSHVAYWWSAEPQRLSMAASQAIVHADELAVAAISWFELAWPCRTGTHPTGDSGAVLASAAGRARSHRRYHALGRRHGGGAALVVPRRSGRPVDLRHRDRTRLAAGDQGPAATQSSAPTTGHRLVAAPIVEGMCRNITELRGLQPPATPVEIAAAARQYVRKVSGITHPSAATAEAFEAAVAEVTATTTRLLDALPPRRQPPKTVPPLRRPDVAARLAGSR